MCGAGLRRLPHFVPFRFPLQDLAPCLARTSGLDPLHKYLKDTYGSLQAHSKALEIADGRGDPLLLLLDGLDEAYEHRDQVVGRGVDDGGLYA